MLFLLAALCAAPPQGPAPAALYGTWRITAEMVEGEVTPEDRFRDLRIEIEGNSLRVREGEIVLECRLGVEANTRTLALTPLSGPRANRPYLGLYTITGQQLKICLLQESQQELPPDMKMDAPKGSGCLLLSLIREK